LLAISFWPLLQLLKYQMPWWSVFHEEVIVWLGPTGLGTRPYFEIPVRMIINGGVFGLFGLLVPFTILLLRKESEGSAVREIALVSLIAIALAIVSNFRNASYVDPLVTALSVQAVVVFA